jgi:4-diphosphocytidyl-2-C-methyl-D-erythritol kinase
LLLFAPAKLNLCLYVGAPRDDGLHEIRSLFEALSLADELEVSEASADEVVCPVVGGENLAAKALAVLRERGWNGPPLRIRIRKRIPVAGGLGGGSADAAAVLRLAEGVDGLEEAAMALGADVASQLAPAFSLVGGAGERVETLPPPGAHAMVLVPQQQGLSTAAVYAEADRLGLGRDRAALEAIEERLRVATAGGASPLDYAQLLSNDLEPAALSLRPEIGDSLVALREAGAAQALITGSGPTAFGLFSDTEAAEAAAASLGPASIACAPRTR